MKRSVFALLSLCALVGLMVFGMAEARWVQKEVKWQISYQGGSATGTNIIVHDTAYAVFGGGTTTLDTTMGFSLDDADVPPRGQVSIGLNEQVAASAGGAAWQNDTTLVGYLVFTSDSSAAAAATMTALTMFIDGRVGGYGPSPAVSLSQGWVKQDSIAISSATGLNMTGATDQSIAFPLRTIGTYGNIRKWGELRAREVSATGTLSACRVFLRYWKNDAGSSQRY